MPTSLIIDPEAINSLRELNPDDADGFLREIACIFIEDTPLRIVELRESFAAADQAKFTRAAHSIKGSSSNLGAAQLRALAADLEHTSKANGLAGLADAIEELARAFETAKAELNRMIPPA